MAWYRFPALKTAPSNCESKSKTASVTRGQEKKGEREERYGWE